MSRLRVPNPLHGTQLGWKIIRVGDDWIVYPPRSLDNPIGTMHDVNEAMKALGWDYKSGLLPRDCDYDIDIDRCEFEMRYVLALRGALDMGEIVSLMRSGVTEGEARLLIESSIDRELFGTLLFGVR